MGMMNNCWYIVRPEIVEDSKSSIPEILFRHPVQPGTGKEGWMQPSVESKIADAKQSSGAPQKQFTREEIEKHNTDGDCWIVVDEKVYDATSVLEWHPGGKAAIMGHAGKVHQDTTEEFASIHDGYAIQKLNGSCSYLVRAGKFIVLIIACTECILGVVTKKAKQFIKKNAEAAAEEKAKSKGNEDITLQKHRWVPVRLKERQEVSEDTRCYTFSLPDSKTVLGLGTCQHILLGFHFADKMSIRSYTPTRPILSSEEDGTFQLVVKTYFPNEDQPGGAMSNILDCMPIGEEVEIKGPTGDITYRGMGKFDIEGKEMTFERVTLILGGSGITPGYQLMARILETKGDKTQLRVIDANKSENDILLRDEMDHLGKEHKDQFMITHVLSHPSDKWKGIKGHVNADIIKEHTFEPKDGNVVFLCGPPAMIQKAALPALKGESSNPKSSIGLLLTPRMQIGDTKRVRTVLVFSWIRETMSLVIESVCLGTPRSFIIPGHLWILIIGRSPLYIRHS